MITKNSQIINDIENKHTGQDQKSQSLTFVNINSGKVDEETKRENTNK